jgi:uncharacterized damage-inducible protein DinB
MRRIVAVVALAALLAAAPELAAEPPSSGAKAEKPKSTEPAKGTAAPMPATGAAGVAAAPTPGGPAKPEMPASATAAPAGVRGEAWRNLNDPAGKLIQLAEAIPADKYTWRPAEGVRSMSEVLLHVAAGNFMIPRRLGGSMPEGFDLKTFETSTTDKAKVIEWLKASIVNATDAIAKLPDAELEKTSKWFDGRMITNREVAIFVGSHDHEHLGQLIAYARMNGVTPPWSAKN